MSNVTLEDAGSLKSVPLFFHCSAAELAAIAALLESAEVTAEAVVFRQGAPGDYMYIIASGQVRIVSDVDTEKVVFAHLAAGDCFGEQALLTGDPRNAGAIASTPTRLWRLSKERFDTLLSQHPAVSAGISRVLSERLARGNTHRFQNEAVPLLSLTPERDQLTIGRLPQNDLVLPDPQVGGIHATLRRSDDRWRIHDEDTEAGTYVNRRRIRDIDLEDGDEILIGTTKVFLDGLAVKSFIWGTGIRIDATGLSRVVAGDKRILDNIALSIQPGEFVAIVGGSGAGKTSLLHALNGFAPATSGDVYYNGVSLYPNLHLFRAVLGYLPQDDIIHKELTVARTLYYAARLRLSSDMGSEEIRQRIDEVLVAVNLSEHRGTEVRRLSGGQRKRVSLAVELLAKPHALFLDEPTSGLDPALESRMMALFRDLTLDGASVVVSTHVTQNLGLCDKVVWLGRGGKLVFFGSPAEALRHFGVQQFGEVYDLLEEPEDLERWSAAFPDSPAYRTNVAGRLESLVPAEKTASLPASKGSGPARGLSTLSRQAFWLTMRYAEVMAKDIRALALYLAQAPAMALALLLIFTRDIFAVSAADGGDVLRATAALKAMVLVAIWLGSFNAAAAISGETAIYQRERLVNLRVVPYVFSKVAVLSVLCFVQSALLVGIVLSWIKLSGLGWDVYPALFGVIFVTALGGLAMGLLVSATASNSAQAMAIVPILLIPQLLFDGSFVPLAKMLAPAHAVANLVLSKWSLELSGNIVNLGTRFANQLPAPFSKPFQDAFDIVPWGHWAVLVALILLPLAATLVAQKRKDLS